MIGELFRPLRPWKMNLRVFDQSTDERVTTMSVRDLDRKLARLNPGALSRRDVLYGMAALGASAVIPELGLATQTGSAVAAHPFRIDTHHLFSVPKLIAEST